MEFEFLQKTFFSFLTLNDYFIHSLGDNSIYSLVIDQQVLDLIDDTIVVMSHIHEQGNEIVISDDTLARLKELRGKFETAQKQPITPEKGNYHFNHDDARLLKEISLIFRNYYHETQLGLL